MQENKPTNRLEPPSVVLVSGGGVVSTIRLHKELINFSLLLILLMWILSIYLSFGFWSLRKTIMISWLHLGQLWPTKDMDSDGKLCRKMSRCLIMKVFFSRCLA